MTFTAATIDGHAGDSLQGLGDVGVRKLAQAFRGNRVDDLIGVALDLHRLAQAAANAGDDDFFQILGRGGGLRGGGAARDTEHDGRCRRGQANVLHNPRSADAWHALISGLCVGGPFARGCGLRGRQNRDGVFVEIFEGEAGAGEQPRERFFRRELADGAPSVQRIDFLGDIHELKAALFGQALQCQPQSLRWNVRLFPDGGLRFRRAGQSHQRQAYSRYAYSHDIPQLHARSGAVV